MKQEDGYMVTDGKSINSYVSCSKSICMSPGLNVPSDNVALFGHLISNVKLDDIAVTTSL